MASELRLILDCVNPTRLSELCEKRGLATGGDQHERRARLARSFRGKVPDLLPHLKRAEMIEVLESFTFEGTEPRYTGTLRHLERATRKEIETVMIKVFNKDAWSPTPEHPHPLENGSVIRFVLDKPNSAEDDGDESADEGDADSYAPLHSPEIAAANGIESTPVPPRSRWRQFILQRDMPTHQETGGSSVQAFQVFERIDSGADPEDPDIRVWAQGMFDSGIDGPWSLLVGNVEGSFVRMTFPSNVNTGMPIYLDLDRPRKPRLAGPWRLLRPDRKSIGSFVLKDICEISATALTSLENTLEPR